jgi:Ribosomal protein L3
VSVVSVAGIQPTFDSRSDEQVNSVTTNVPKSTRRSTESAKVPTISSSQQIEGDKKSATTTADLTEKHITPLGGFPRYGEINNDWLMIKGGVVGPRKRFLLLRKSLYAQVSRKSLETITLKFIDTSSKMGHGRFQTKEEKEKFYSTRTLRLAKERAA